MKSREKKMNQRYFLMYLSGVFTRIPQFCFKIIKHHGKGKYCLNMIYRENAQIHKIKQGVKIIAVFAYILLAAGIPGKAIFSQNIIDLDKVSMDSVNVADYLYLYEDKTANLVLQDILRDKLQHYEETKTDYPAYGFTKSAVWGKFTWKGRGAEPYWYLVFDYVLLDKIELYVVDQKGRELVKQVGGDTLELSSKEFRHRKSIFKLQLPADTVQTIFFRVVSEDTLEIPVVLVSEQALHDRDTGFSLIMGIYYGILISMFFYNFFIYVTLRDRAYLNYVMYLIFFGIVQFGIDGLLYQYIFPSGGYAAKIARMVCANFSIIFALRFSDNFFHYRDNFPRFNYIVYFIYNLAIMNSILVFFNFRAGSQIVFGMLLFSVLIFLYFSVKLFKRYPPVRLYFLAWIVFIGGTFLWSLKLFHIYIPFITTYAMQIGSAVEVMLLSFALGSRINLINAEREAMRLESLKQKQIVEKSRFQLESLRSRTRELERDLLMARDIQLSMIPIHSEHPDIRSIYLPMDKVGGDFYDIIKLGESKLGIFISDVSGHGIPAALITAMLRSMLLTGIREMAADLEKSWLLDPRRFMVHMNNSLFGHLHGNIISALYGIYDKETKTFEYIGAAHTPPILMERKDGTEEVNLSFIKLAPQMPPWGVKKMTDTDFTNRPNSLTLSPGSRLLFYSDGLMDNVDYDFNHYETGLDSFKGNILYDIFRNSASMNLQTLLETISIQLLLYRDMRALEDDVCVVVLEENNVGFN